MDNINNKKALLDAAAKKLGVSADVLERQLRDGTFEKALRNMPSAEAAMLTKALSDKAACERILSSPQAQALYKKLSGK